MKNVWKRLFCFVLAFGICFIMATPAQASTAGRARKAYKAFLAGESQNAEFSLIYLDNNKVPELVYFPYAGTYQYVYKFKNGQMKQVAEIESMYALRCYKKQGDLTTYYYHHAGVESETYYRYYKGKMTKKWEAENPSTSWARYYNADWNTITKAKYKRGLKKFTGTARKKSVKMRYNTAANRKKYI